MDIEDSKYETLVAGKAEAESKAADLQSQLDESIRKVETLEAEKVKAEEARDAEKTRADEAEEKTRVSAMRDERLATFGTGFRAKLDKLETTKANVTKQAASLSDEEWEARVVELEEGWDIKRDAVLDADAKGDGEGGEGGKEPGKGDPPGLFSREQVAGSAANQRTEEVTASETAAEEPSQPTRQSVMGGLVRRSAPSRPNKETAKA